MWCVVVGFSPPHLRPRVLHIFNLVYGHYRVSLHAKTRMALIATRQAWRLGMKRCECFLGFYLELLCVQGGMYLELGYNAYTQGMFAYKTCLGYIGFWQRVLLFNMSIPNFFQRKVCVRPTLLLEVDKDVDIDVGANLYDD